MNILVTGAKGFVGKNLIATLHNIKDGRDRSFGLDPDITVFEYDVDTDPVLLDGYCKAADFVFHLAVATAVELEADGDHGIPVDNYVDENVSTKVVKIIQSYTGIVDRMVWRKC